MEQIITAAYAGEAATGLPLKDLTGNNCTQCVPTEAALQTSLQNLAQKSGSTGIEAATKDAWGNLFFLDENELEYSDTDCRRDALKTTGTQYHLAYYFNYSSAYCNNNPVGTAGWQ
jgi:hypothetical protein